MNAVATTSRGYPIDTVRELEAKNSGAGQHFFDADTLRFFDSRVSEDVYRHRFFFTSEKGPGGKRRASIRMIMDDGHVETVGEFQRFANPAAARKALATELAVGVEVRNDPYENDTEPTNPRRYNWRAYVGALPVGSRTTKWHAQRIAAQAKRPAYTGGR